MKKLIGLLAVIFIVSTGQVFAQSTTIDAKNVIVKVDKEGECAPYIKAKLTEFLLNEGFNLTADETKASFILNVTQINVFIEKQYSGAANVSFVLELVEKSSSKVVAYAVAKSSPYDSVSFARVNNNSDSVKSYTIDVMAERGFSYEFKESLNKILKK